MYLQSSVVPIVTYVNIDGIAQLKEFFGSAFFINNKGTALTARHVVENANKHAKMNDQLVGLVVKGETGNSSQSEVAGVKQFEVAPNTYDVAIINSSYLGKTQFTLNPFEIEVWADVATYGYPESLAVKEDDALWISLRCFKGYLQRLIPAQDVNRAAAFEVSFSIGVGQSGSPVFKYGGEVNMPVGICIGTHRSERIDDKRVETRDDGTMYEEVTLKIEEFGIVQDLRPLLNWRPSIFGGRDLLNISQARLPV